jgi:hypothetical protein
VKGGGGEGEEEVEEEEEEEEEDEDEDPSPTSPVTPSPSCSSSQGEEGEEEEEEGEGDANKLLDGTGAVRRNGQPMAFAVIELVSSSSTPHQEAISHIVPRDTRSPTGKRCTQNKQPLS